ncbi:MAG: caspase family protein [Spirochaetales bacterium]|nr:caspase family protein [Spirochaetales bacterium]
MKQSSSLFCIISLFLTLVIPPGFTLENPEMKIQSGHGDVICDISVSPCGRYALTASWGNEAILWDVKKAKEIRSFQAEILNLISFSPSGTLAAGVCNTILAKVWEVATGKELLTLKGHTYQVIALCFSPDESRVITSSYDDTIKIWDIKNGNCIKTISGDFTNDIEEIIPVDDRYILTRSLDYKLFLIDLEKEVSSKEYFSPGVKPMCIALSPDRETLATGYNDGKVVFRYIFSGKVIQLLRTGNLVVKSISYSPDGKKMIAGLSNGSIQIIDIRKRKVLGSFYHYSDPVHQVRFVCGGEKYLSCKQWDTTLLLCNTETGEVEKQLSGTFPDIRESFLIQNENCILSRYLDGTIFVWDVKQAKPRTSITTKSNCCAVSPDTSMMLSGEKKGESGGVVNLVDSKTFEVKKSFYGHTGNVLSVCFSPGGRLFASSSGDDTVRIWDSEKNAPLHTINIPSPDEYSNIVWALCFHPDNSLLYAGDERGNLRVIDCKSGTILHLLETGLTDIQVIRLTYDGKKLVTGSFDALCTVWDTSTWQKLLTYKGHDNAVRCLDISAGGNHVLSGSDDTTIHLWNIATGETIKIYRFHTNTICSLAFTKDTTHFLSSCIDGSVRLWDMEKDKSVTFLTDYTTSRWLVFTHDGYWDSSHKGGDLIAMVRGMESWNIDQFAVKTNRPDMILQQLGQDDKELLEFYRKKYLSRLKKLGLNENDLETGYHTPEACIVSSKQEGNMVELECEYSDPLYKLAAYYIYVNDVPLSGAEGKPLKGEKQKTKNRIELTPGINKIEVSAVNKKGTESYRDFIYITGPGLKKKYKQVKIIDVVKNSLAEKAGILKDDIIINVNNTCFFSIYEMVNYIRPKQHYLFTIIRDKKEKVIAINKTENIFGMDLSEMESTGEISGDLYFIGFGVSHYKDDSLNLHYAHKDVQDLAMLFSKMKNRFNTIHLQTFINEQVTVETIKKAKELLKTAKPDDTFILFISGHGVHDTDELNTYYYLTHEADVHNLSQTAASFEIIEDILQGINPRKKLFLMDTCESGEVPEDMMEHAATLESDKKEMRARAIEHGDKGIKNVLIKKKKTRSYLFEMDRYIHNDLKRRSGAIVFSSCRGGEFSYEDARFENGLFTEEILTCFSGGTGDSNNDGVISIEELKNHVRTAVPGLSNGLQNPTVDRDNIYIQYGFPVLVEDR